MANRTLRLALALALWCSSATAQVGSYSNGDVVRISDGDTITVNDSGKELKVRLFGIDAPELSQAYGPEARQHLVELIGDGPVTVFIRAGDRYGRLVGEVYRDGLAINREMVRSGFAWWYEAYSSYDRDLARLQNDARNMQVGLWSDGDPVAPWEFRRDRSRERFGASFPMVKSYSVTTMDDFALDESDVLFAGLTGYDLLDVLKEQYEPEYVHSYRAAREYMFCIADHQDGAVELAYTGELFEFEDSEVCGIPDHEFVNTEHIWPQSKFGRNRTIKADIHLLAPVYSRVNSSRSNKPFAEIRDEETDAWWGTEFAVSMKPERDSDSFSESSNEYFEPREEFKGDVARAMFYVFTIYHDANLALDWFWPQVGTLLAWNADDPPDDSELARMESVALTQGNQNPFVLDPSLAERVFGLLE